MPSSRVPDVLVTLKAMIGESKVSFTTPDTARVIVVVYVPSVMDGLPDNVAVMPLTLAIVKVPE